MNYKLELLEIIEKQKDMIDKQNETISKLVNESAEQEDMIDELMKGMAE